MNRLHLMALCLLSSLGTQAQTRLQPTRGIGLYPGSPSEFFGPRQHRLPASAAPRNLALHRAAWASSTADYNHTAHLVTDGILDDSAPALLTVTTPAGQLPRREAEWAIDGGVYSSNLLMGERTWITWHWQGEAPFALPGQATSSLPALHAVQLDARVAYDDHRATQGYAIRCQASTDGQTWFTLGALTGTDLPGTPMRYKLHSDPNKQTSNVYLPARVLDQTIPLRLPASTASSQASLNFFRLELEMEGAAYWDLHELHFLDEAGQELCAQPSQRFSSQWLSADGGEQWLTVDLGAPASIERITPHWAEEPILWHSEVADSGRTVRLVMEEPGPSGRYALRELEVWGTGGVTFEPAATAPFTPATSATRLELSGGNWQLQRASEVTATGETIASPGFDTGSWLLATVPGTVLTSFVNLGAVPNPNYADWVDQISESFFRSNFWYRNEFDVPATLLRQGCLQRLHFDGINYRARVFLNGLPLGTIDGAFMRGEFNVSGLLREGRNVLAVEIICNEHFGSVKEKNENTTQFNGGILGADNPTFHATIGWDWITTVRGRNAGIWNEVYLTSQGGVTLSDPYVRTRLLSDQQTSITPSVFLRNHTGQAVSGTLTGWVGTVQVQKTVCLPAGCEQEISFLPADFPQLTASDFRLWWPNGYGDPYRYDAGFRFTPTSDATEATQLTFKAGLREMTYEGLADSLILRVNGRRFIPLGGNWGFDEHNLCYRSREYLTAVAYHRDMHCTMIRNWVGMIGDEAFYDACDSLGIMVWQDFWLANPADGPDPYDERLFMNCAQDYVRRIRHYACLGLFCGRNEGYPPATIDRALRHIVSDLTPGMAYIPNSADDCVTGHGPYCAQPARTYFEHQSGKIHTERGMPAVMNIESLTRTFSPDALWPQSRQWGQHDYTLQGAQRAQEFNDLVSSTFGQEFTDAAQFSRAAQLINYNGYRAMFESTSCSRAGLLIWMSHPCWPSMVWQTYDYYFDPTAAYFGVKKACEPLHIQLNALTDSVEVVNTFAANRPGLTATATLYDLTGRRLWRRTTHLASTTDTTLPLFPVQLTEGGLLRLELSDKRELLSVNDYLLPAAVQPQLSTSNSQASTLNSLRKTTRVTTHSDRQQAEVTLRNSGRTAALLLRLNLKDGNGEQILPAIYSDNYFNLLPGEQKTVTITWHLEDAHAPGCQVELTTLN